MGNFNMTNEMKEYFDSLPMNIRQELVESGAKITSLDALRKAAENMTGDTDEKQL